MTRPQGVRDFEFRSTSWQPGPSTHSPLLNPPRCGPCRWRESWSHAQVRSGVCPTSLAQSPLTTSQPETTRPLEKRKARRTWDAVDIRLSKQKFTSVRLSRTRALDCRLAGLTRRRLQLRSGRARNDACLGGPRSTEHSWTDRSQAGSRSDLGCLQAL